MQRWENEQHNPPDVSPAWKPFIGTVVVTVLLPGFSLFLGKKMPSRWKSDRNQTEETVCKLLLLSLILFKPRSLFTGVVFLEAHSTYMWFFFLANRNRTKEVMRRWKWQKCTIVYVFPTCSSTSQLTQHPPHPTHFLSNGQISSWLLQRCCYRNMSLMAVKTCLPHSSVFSSFQCKGCKISQYSFRQFMVNDLLNHNSRWWKCSLGRGVWVTSIVSNLWLKFCGLEPMPLVSLLQGPALHQILV